MAESTQKTRVNICDIVGCPYNVPSGSGKSDGCQRYAVALHCHLTRDNGEPREGVSQGIYQSQYWLFGDGVDIDIEKLKADQQAWLESPDEAARLQTIQRRQERMKA